MASFVGPHGELPKPVIFLMANWWWIWGKLTMPETSFFLGWVRTLELDFLRSGSFLAESSLCVTSSKSRNPKGFITKRGEWSKDSWESIRIFTILSLSLFAQFVLWSLRNPKCVLWSTKADHGWVSWRNQEGRQVEVVGDSHLYQLPSIICLIRQHLSSLQNWW